MARHCRAVVYGADALWTMARQNVGYGTAEPVGYGAVFEIISLDYVRFRNSQRMIQTDGYNTSIVQMEYKTTQ